MVYSGGVGAPLPNPVFQFDPGDFVSANGLISQWNDSSGNGNHLKQATASARPVAGIRYLSLPGSVGNYASTPDSAALSITGDIDIRVKVSLDNWDDAGTQVLLAKESVATTPGTSYRLDVTNGKLRCFMSDGTSAAGFSSANLSISNGQIKGVRVTANFSTNQVIFYTSDNFNNWTQLGSPLTISTITAIQDAAHDVAIGARLDTNSPPTSNEVTGKIYRAQVYNGIAGTLVLDAIFEATAEGVTSFTESSSNSATVTISQLSSPAAELIATDTNKAYFDGIQRDAETDADVLDDPFTLYTLIKSVTHVDGAVLFDFGAGGTIEQGTNEGEIVANFGAESDPITLALDTWGVLTVVNNGGTNDIIQLNNGTPITGNFGGGTPDAFKMGSDGTTYWNGLEISAIGYAGAHSASQIGHNVNYLLSLSP